MTAFSGSPLLRFDWLILRKELAAVAGNRANLFTLLGSAAIIGAVAVSQLHAAAAIVFKFGWVIPTAQFGFLGSAVTLFLARRLDKLAAANSLVCEAALSRRIAVGYAIIWSLASLIVALAVLGFLVFKAPKDDSWVTLLAAPLAFGGAAALATSFWMLRGRLLEKTARVAQQTISCTSTAGQPNRSPEPSRPPRPLPAIGLAALSGSVLGLCWTLVGNRIDFRIATGLTGAGVILASVVMLRIQAQIVMFYQAVGRNPLGAITGKLVGFATFMVALCSVTIVTQPDLAFMILAGGGGAFSAIALFTCYRTLHYALEGVRRAEVLMQLEMVVCGTVAMVFPPLGLAAFGARFVQLALRTNARRWLLTV